ncbi:MAG: hypothetical protein ABSA52_21225 [Candidatus Binatia bacterium]
MNDLKVIEAFSRLKSLRQNVPNGPVETRFVSEFHDVLTMLEATSGVKLDSFGIPASEVRPIVTSFSYVTGEADYSSERYCDYAFFIMKVDGVLTMFELLISQGPGSKAAIGFKPPG